ncbi:hypothetical protein [Flavobacterium cerinum]|uniref:Uncharacterized protein n=1 Tax=Flavobacterium cerinum TaxID=2502784 RepID=A0ABY5IPV7_9FLAO|nr:hypothetical protein [Flavobacterium cerinum]UUC44880.1 hypothetical protein NOX80_14770 [Flavobacterium cerinum]
MKKIILLLTLCPLLLFSQVGVNTTTPHSSSILDVTATDKGLLIPRIAIPNLNAAAPVTSPATSLLVYNTNVTTGAGFYYWNGTKWIPISGAHNDWIISGNDMYNANSGNVGVGTTAPTAKLHVENTAGASITPFSGGFESGTITPFSTSGSGGSWSVTSTSGQFNVGTYGIKSGSGVSSSTSNLDLSVTIPTGGSSFSFNYRVDSESGYDYLRFYIDGVQQNQWSGTVAWATFSGTLAAGSHTLSWRYEKDSSTNSGLDAAFLDQIVIANTQTLSPAVRIVDGSQGNGKVLTSDANGYASWRSTNLPDIATFQGMIIPTCDTYSNGSTGSFTIPIRGVSTTVSWTILAKQTRSASATISGNTVALAPITAERLQVRYDFSPQLPFSPLGIIFNAYNSSGYPDTFVINYANKSQSSITVNIARADLFASQTSNCWTGQFYFDVMVMN